MSDDDQDNECPLCMEEIDVYDKYFRPCPCGYQLCRFCWNHIKKDLNALCPACRRPYSDEDIQFKPVSPEEIQRIKNQKKRNEKEKKDTDQTNRKQLANVRVVQKNLVYVLGLPPKLCTEDVLKSNDYFGQYGKITKVVINRKTNNQNTGVYITYLKKDDAQRAIEQVDGTDFEGKVLRATFGTTKYCSYYLKGQPCQNIGCQFLHESGEDAESFLKEESRLYKYMMLISQRGEKPMKLAFASNKDSNDPSIPNNVAWGKTVPISLRNSQQFPSLGGSSSQSTDNHGPLEFKGQEKHSDNDLLGSSALDDSAAFVPDLTDPLTLRKAGLLLLPRYNGLFDPFGSDRLLKTLMALVSEKGPDVANSPPLTQSHSTNELDLPDSGGRKSRYERLFDSSSTIAEQTNVANSKQEQKSAEQVNRNGDPPPSDQQISFFQNHQVRLAFFVRPPPGQSGGHGKGPSAVKAVVDIPKKIFNSKSTSMPNSKDLKDSEFPAELEQEETPGAAHANLLQHNDTHVYKLGTKKNRVLVIASKMEPESQPVGENAQEQPFDTKEVLSPNSKQPIPSSHTPPLAFTEILPTSDQVPQVDPVIARKTKAKVYNPNLIAKKTKSVKKVSQKSSQPEATNSVSDMQKSPKHIDLEKKIDHMEKLAQSLAELLVLIESEVGSRDEFIKRFKAFSRYSTPAEFVEKSLVPLLSTAQLLHSQLTDGKIVIEPPENHASRLKTLENIILSLIFSQKVLLEYKTAPDIEKMVQNRKIEEYVAESDDYVDEIEEIRPLQYLDQLMNIIHALFIKDQPRGSKGKVLKGPSAPYPSDPFLALAAATGLDPPTIINLSPSRQKEFIMKIQKLFPNPADLMANIFEKPGSIDFHLLLYGNVDEKTRLETRVTDLEKFIAFCKQEKQQQNQIYMNIKTENDKWRPEVEALLNPDKDDEWVDEN